MSADIDLYIDLRCDHFCLRLIDL